MNPKQRAEIEQQIAELRRNSMFYRLTADEEQRISDRQETEANKLQALLNEEEE